MNKDEFISEYRLGMGLIRIFESHCNYRKGGFRDKNKGWAWN